MIEKKFNAIVGAKGSGKSTIVQLLLKNYEQQKGTITVGGANLSFIPADWLRDRIGYVEQEPVIFAGTLRDNIKVGKADASDDDVYEALRKAELEEFVQNLQND